MRDRSESALSAGAILDGRYELRELLGSGAHAYVWRAYHTKLERDVAVKVLKVDALTEDPARLENLTRRFEREARMIARLRDPHTITMYDCGIAHDRFPYMVVEYIRGTSLKQIIRQKEPLAPERVAMIIYQILCSLQEAHAIGVLHRDIKPDNIMLATHLGRADQVKLLDFGIAKLTDGEQADLTAEGSIVGTPRYIAPERIRGELLGPPSDLYAVGLIAWEMLTGSRVLEGIRGVRVLQEHLSGPSIKLPPALPIPEPLRRLVDKMTEKSLDERYRLAQDVIEDLEVHYSATFEARPAPLFSSPPADAQDGPIAAPGPAPAAWSSPNSTWFAVLLAVLLAASIACLGGVLAWRLGWAPL